MNEIRIPKRFKLLAQTISVELTDRIASHNGTLGEARAIQNSILLQKSVDGFPIPETQRLHIFWHEAVHLAMHAMGLDEMASDETFVDLLAGCITQIITTSEYEDVKKSRKRQ